VVGWGEPSSVSTWLLMGALVVLTIYLVAVGKLFFALVSLLGAMLTYPSLARSTQRTVVRIQGGHAEVMSTVALPLPKAWRIRRVLPAIRPEHVHLLHRHVQPGDSPAYDIYDVIVVSNEGLALASWSFLDVDEARYLFRILLGSVPGSAEALSPTFTPRDPDEHAP
jgi:hypothetical protein